MSESNFNRKRSISEDTDSFGNDLETKKRLIRMLNYNFQRQNLRSSNDLHLPIGSSCKRSMSDDTIEDWNCTNRNYLKNVYNSTFETSNFMNEHTSDLPQSAFNQEICSSIPPSENNTLSTSFTDMNLNETSMETSGSPINTCTDLILHPGCIQRPRDLKSLMWSIVSQKEIRDLLNMTKVQLDDQTRNELLKRLKQMNKESEDKESQNSHSDPNYDIMSSEDFKSPLQEMNESNDWMDIDMNA